MPTSRRAEGLHNERGKGRALALQFPVLSGLWSLASGLWYAYSLRRFAPPRTGRKAGRPKGDFREAKVLTPSEREA